MTTELKDLYYIAGLLTNKSILKIDQISRNGDGVMDKTRFSCLVRHHSKGPLLLVQKYFGGKLKETAKNFELKIGAETQVDLFTQLNPLVPYKDKLLVALEMKELQKARRPDREEVYQKIVDKFRATQDNHIPHLPNEYLKFYLGGALDDCLNCFIYPKPGCSPSVVATLKFKYPFLFGLVGMEKSTINVNDVFNLTSLWGQYMTDSNARLQEFGQLLFSGEEICSNWALRREG